MNRRLILGVSIALALLSALLLQLYKKNLADELGVGGPRVNIVVAREALRYVQQHRRPSEAQLP